MSDSTAEERLAADGVPLREIAFPNYDDPEIEGCVVVGLHTGGLVTGIAVRPGLTGEARNRFAEWAESRIMRFAEHGPNPDGWQHRSDGDWQLWARTVELPSLE